MTDTEQETITRLETLADKMEDLLIYSQRMFSCAVFFFATTLILVSIMITD